MVKSGKTSGLGSQLQEGPVPLIIPSHSRPGVPASAAPDELLQVDRDPSM
jgi:hypothetical protein